MSPLKRQHEIAFLYPPRNVRGYAPTDYLLDCVGIRTIAQVDLLRHPRAVLSQFTRPVTLASRRLRDVRWHHSMAPMPGPIGHRFPPHESIFQRGSRVLSSLSP